MKRFVSLVCALAGAAACGDNLNPGGGDDTDAVQVDAPNPDAPTDAPTDAPIDAAPPRFSGTLTIIEGSVFAAVGDGPVNTPIGQGIQLGVTFTDATMAVAPVLDTAPGTLFGCKVTVLDTPQELASSLGINEGPVTFTVTSTPAAPTFPTCVFGATTGYVCPDLTSSQAITATNTITLTMLSPTASRIDINGAGTATFALDDIGRYIKFSGTLVPSLDASFAAFPIVAAGAACTGVIGVACNANQAVVGLPLTIATLPLTMGSLSTLAGVGPQPSLADPGQLQDNASATAVLSSSTNFPGTTVTYGDAANDFTMDDTNADRLRNIPRDGSAFSINCNNCGDAIGSVLAITTTNAPLTGISSKYAMPTGTARTSIRCAVVGSSQIDVPANVSAFIMNSGATRIQANYVRGKFGTPAPANAGLAGVISGHAYVGFTQVP